MPRIYWQNAFLQPGDTHKVQPETAAIMTWLDSGPFSFSLLLSAGGTWVEFPYYYSSTVRLIHDATLLSSHLLQPVNEGDTTGVPTSDDDVFRFFAHEYAKAHGSAGSSYSMSEGLACSEIDTRFSDVG